MTVSPVLREHIRMASCFYRLAVARDGAWVRVDDFALPAGFNVPVTQVLASLPPDYPLRAPGVLPWGLFLRPGLRYHGRCHPNIVEGQGPGWGAWSWLCILRVAWDPRRDDLLRCLEMVRAVLSAPSGW